MSKAILLIDMPESCSKCQFMYEFYGVKKCQLLNILQNGGKAIIPTETLSSRRKDCCPLKFMPVYREENHTSDYSDIRNEGFNACLDEILDS